MTTKKRLNYFLNIASGILWLAIFLLPFPLEKLGISVSLSLIAILQILSNLCQANGGKKQEWQRAKKLSKGTSCATKSYNLVHNTPPCDLDLSKLDISNGSPKVKVPRNHIISRSSGFTKPRPVISPSRFSSSSFELVIFKVESI